MSQITVQTMIVVVCVAGASGCGSSNDLPSELPKLPAPPAAPPAIPTVKPITAELKLFSPTGQPLPGDTPVGEEFNPRLSFKMPPTAPVDPFVVIQVGKKRRDDRFVIHNEKAMELRQPEAGEYRVDLKLKAPIEPGNYIVRARLKDLILIEVPLRVVLQKP